MAGTESTLSDFSRVMRRWGADEGLTGVRAEQVVQTPDGHLWVGAEDGLFHFNGRLFEKIDTATVPELGHKWVTRMCLASDGSLWLSTMNGRIACFSNGRFNAVTLPEGTPNLAFWSPHPKGGVLAAIQGPDGTILARLTESGVEPLSEPLGLPIVTAWADRDGRVWLAMVGMPVGELRDGKLVPGAASSAPDTSVFLERRDGNLLAVGRTGIFEMSGKEWMERVRFTPPLASRPTFAVEDLDRRVWFGGQQSDRMVWQENEEPRKMRSDRASLPAVIQSATVDKDGNLWFATFSGLFQARYLPVITWKPPVELPTERVVSVRIRPDGTIWFQGFGGICKLSPGDPRPTFEAFRPTAELTIFDADESGNIWLGQRNGGPLMIRGQETTRIPVAPRDGQTAATTLVVDHDGIVWFTTMTDVFRCDPRLHPMEFVKASGAGNLPSGDCHNIRLLGDGSLLVAARGHGVFWKGRGKEEWSLVTPADDPHAAMVRTMDRDSQGRIWGYNDREKSIGCWDAKTGFKASLSDLGLAGIEVRGIALDDIGGLWIGTRNHGLAMARCDALLEAMGNPGNPPPLTWFDAVDGLGSKGGTFSSEGIRKGPDGRVWIATDGGLSVVDPRQWAAERGRSSPLSVSIEQCTADGKPIALDSLIRIPAGTARIGIRFATLDFGFPGEITYRHRLRGIDEAWIEDGGSEIIYLQQLRPGDYEFEVIAANRFGIWSSQPATLRLKVLPHWWQRADARLAGMMVLALIIGLIVRARLRSLRSRAALRAEFSRQLIVSQENERRRISRELHDSLGQNLLIAKNQLHLASAIDDDPALQEKLGKVAASVGAALEEARTISHQLRPFHLERLGLAKAMKAMIRETTDSTKIPIDASIEEIDGLLSGESETMVYRILQESLTNIVKHADASRIVVRIGHLKNHLRLVVSDDGRGFDPKLVFGDDPARHGLGLTSFEERIELLGGRFHCRSQPGYGTTLTFEISIPPSHGRKS